MTKKGNFYKKKKKKKENLKKKKKKKKAWRGNCTSSANSHNLLDWQKVVQFAGDAGTGVGSRIKGYHKYGGKWFEIIPGRRGNVFFKKLREIT